jgi:hypothetical protein
MRQVDIVAATGFITSWPELQRIFAASSPGPFQSGSIGDQGLPAVRMA